ncbi:MAG: DEAD/DEAH box helicase [Clostridia bacterium]|nr:DEAD/DEAH box helicase [Clostridia bacterium]
MGNYDRPSKVDANKVVTAIKTADKIWNELSDNLKAPAKNVKALHKELADIQRKERFSKLSIDDLNSNNEGIKVSTLKNAGINDLAQVVDMSINDLAAIEGIGDVQASKIKTKCNEIKLMASSAITLNVEDEKSVSMIELLYSIILLNSSDLEDKIHEYYDTYHQIVVDNISDADALYSSIWLFTKKQNKENRLNAYSAIKEVYDSGYFDEAGNAKQKYDSLIASANKDIALTEYKKNTAPFYALLEKICGKGTLKTEAEIFQLPKELIAEIEALKPDLSLMNATLRSYQEFGTKYIINQERVLLGDEMGLGKTMQAIAAMAHLKMQGCNRFLVVCPVSVLVNWGREISTHSKMETMEIYGNDREDEYKRWLDNGGVAITTFETLTRLDLDLLQTSSEGEENSPNKTIDMLVVDEAHYVKNPDAKRTVALKKVSENTDHCLFMTGTPLENKVEEMIFLISLLRPNLSGELNSMRALSKAPEFKEKIAPVYLRRVREDVLTELPEKVESEEWCKLGENETKVYKQSLFSKNMADMRRVSYNAEKIEDSCKLNRIIEICNDAKENKRKIIIFSFFLDTINRVQEALGDRCFGTITGAISSDKRQGIIDEFAKAEDGTVLVSQITAGGVGLNIQCASVVILCEPQWKPSIENQAISRCYRMGQANSVLVYRILASKTVDERVIEILKEKSEVFENFADESEIDSVNKSIINDIIEEERAAYGITDTDEGIDSNKEDAEVSSEQEVQKIEDNKQEE